MATNSSARDQKKVMADVAGICGTHMIRSDESGTLSLVRPRLKNVCVRSFKKQGAIRCLVYGGGLDFISRVTEEKRQKSVKKTRHGFLSNLLYCEVFRCGLRSEDEDVGFDLQLPTVRNRESLMMRIRGTVRRTDLIHTGFQQLA
ncbi:uncharacterized [Tachysurus ichikawai]